jgi:hypothetical protein
VVTAIGPFSDRDLVGLPEPVRRYLHRSIAPGSPVVEAAELTMRVRIRIGRWLPFRAHEILDPHRGFVWKARVAGVIRGSDRYVDGAGSMRWRLGGLVPIVRADGPDVSRSGAGRAGAEALWLPTALLPRFGVTWSADSDERITASFTVGGEPLQVSFALDPTGGVRSFVFDRWGDPDRTGTWGLHPCGGEVTGYGSFGGLTIPIVGRLGWHYGTDRWPEGEFFRFEIQRVAGAGRVPSPFRSTGPPRCNATEQRAPFPARRCGS